MSTASTAPRRARPAPRKTVVSFRFVKLSAAGKRLPARFSRVRGLLVFRSHVVTGDLDGTEAG